MSESLFHPSWYRVAPLAPRLRSHVQVHRHHYRGRLWFVLQNHASGRFFRFTPAANFVLGMMDGRRTLESIWELACERLGDDAPTQGEIVRLMAQLHDADALLSGLRPDSDEMAERSRKSERNRVLAYVRNPLALRMPLLDPDRFIVRTLPAVRWLFTPLGAVLWVLLIVTALVQVGVHWAPLTQNITDRVLSLENLLLLWAIFPLVKIVHEFGHAYAVRRWGGEVHEMGIMLLVLVPIPYVDATAASALRSRYQRVVIGAAGMLSELALAALAMFVWMAVEPGMLRATAFNVMLVAGVSTLLFNLNPLLRFDGYYMLGDLIEIPNLGPRSNRYLGYLVNRYAFGVKHLESIATSAGERYWFVGYGIASFVYRAVIVVVIISFVGSKYFLIGVLLAFWALYVLVLRPLSKRLGYLLFDPTLTPRRGRALAVSAAVAVALIAPVLAVPVPLWTNAQGVVWVPEDAWVRAQSAGFVETVLAGPGTPVAAGEALVERAEPVLSARVALLEAAHDEAQVRYEAALPSDRVRAENLREEVHLIERQLADARAREADLTVRSPLAGTFVSALSTRDMPGRFVDRGAALGYVIAPGPVTVRVVVPQASVDLVRSRTRAVDVLMSGNLKTVVAGQLVRETPGASNALPSAALTLEGGGRFAVDPRKTDMLAALDPVFQFDVALPPGTISGGVGERVYVRISHGREVLALRWYRLVRRLLLRQFDV